jgi:hypothetical protein
MLSVYSPQKPWQETVIAQREMILFSFGSKSVEQVIALMNSLHSTIDD